MSDEHEFISLQKINFADAGEHGLALRLETQRSLTHGKTYAFGCLLDEYQGRKFLQLLSSELEKKWGNTQIRH